MTLLIIQVINTTCIMRRSLSISPMNLWTRLKHLDRKCLGSTDPETGFESQLSHQLFGFKQVTQPYRTVISPTGLRPVSEGCCLDSLG